MMVDQTKKDKDTKLQGDSMKAHMMSQRGSIFSLFTRRFSNMSITNNLSEDSRIAKALSRIPLDLFAFNDGSSSIRSESQCDQSSNFLSPPILRERAASLPVHRVCSQKLEEDVSVDVHIPDSKNDLFQAKRLDMNKPCTHDTVDPGPASSHSSYTTAQIQDSHNSSPSVNAPC